MIPEPDGSASVPTMDWSWRVLLVADVVESVRLIDHHGAEAIERWRRVIAEVRRQLLAGSGGRMVKSLGDGMLIEMPDLTSALKVAFGLQPIVDRVNAGLAPDAQIVLRTGLACGDVAIDADDVFGAPVNLAARLAGRADPGQIVASDDVAGRLVDGLDASLEDLGTCYLKNLEAPVRAYRLWPVPAQGAARSAVPARPAVADLPAFDLRPLVAVLPPAARDGERLVVAAEMLAESVVLRLSRSDRVRVCSLLSTRAFVGREASLLEVASRLGAHYVVSGSMRAVGERFVASLELADATGGDVIWSERLSGRMVELAEADDPHGGRAADAIMQALVASGLRRARVLPVPSLDGFALQTGAMSLMHRPSASDFLRARELLDHLVERHPRAAPPRAWLAKWYVLRTTRGWAGTGAPDSQRALEQARRAVDLDGGSSFAHAMEAFVRCHLLRDLDRAGQSLQRALEAGQSEPLSWLVQCVVSGFRGDGEVAWEAARRALVLSPLDPMRHYFESLAASAAVAANRLDDAIALARASLRGNCDHPPTLRVLAVSLAETGRASEARTIGRRILEADPGFNIAGYVAVAPPGAERTRARYAHALRQAGLPEH